jgi:hypothetical protein
MPQRELREKLEELAKQTGYLVNPSSIPVKCPYCNHVNDYEDEVWGDGYEIELDCAECGRWLTTELDCMVLVAADEVEKDEDDEDG